MRATVQVANDAEWVREFESTCPRCKAAGLGAVDFRYSPGWVTLWRRHAKEVVAKEHLYDDAISHWGWSKLVNGIPDESYWSMLAQHLGHQITGELTTYMEEGDAKTGHSKMFKEEDVARLWAQPKPSFFARKFPTTPKIDKALSERIIAARGLKPAPAAAPAAPAKGPGGKGPGKGRGKGPGKGRGVSRRSKL